MALAPLKPCRSVGCPALTRDGYCPRHLSAEKNTAKKYGRGKYGQRPSSSARGYDGRWKRYRLVYLAEHPWCKICLDMGIHEPATDVDHVVPHKGDPTRFWDPENHQGLCASCHSRKTASEDGGFGNPPTRKKF